MYQYNAIVESVHDGDTLHASIDLGMGFWNRGLDSALPGVILRLAGCNARELAQPGGKEAGANLKALLPPGTKVVVDTVLEDKYGGRYDAHITLADGTDLVAQLVAQQWAAAWDGKGAKPVPPWPRKVA